MSNVLQPVEHSREGHSWHEVGEGDEAIVFLHPIVGSSVYWTPQLLSLSGHYRCLAWNAPGYRGTDPAKEPLADSVTAQLVDFLDVVGLGRAHVVGLSLGAMYALHAVAAHPDRFGHMVVADTSAAFGIDPNEWLDDWLGDLRSGTPLTEVVAGSIDAISVAPVDAELRSAIVASFEEVPNVAFEAASRYIAFHDVRESITSIENKTLVLVGEHDGETPPEYGEEIAQLIPNATFEQIAGLGHLTSIEAPQQFSDRVRSFLAS